MYCTKIILLIILVNSAIAKGDCSCAPIEGKKNRTFEFVGFHALTTTLDFYKTYDYDKLTTIIITGVDAGTRNMTSYAHQREVRVLLKIIPPTDVLLTSDARRRYVDEQMTTLVANDLDGFYVAYGNNLGHETRNGFTQLIILLRQRLNGRNPRYVLSLGYVYCVWCIGERTFDYDTIKHHIDYFNVMMQDFQHNTLEEFRGTLCKAESQDRFNEVEQHMNHWLQSGIPSQKIVISFAWAGRFQQCVEYNSETDECYIQCSDVNGAHFQMCMSTFYHYVLASDKRQFRGGCSPWEYQKGYRENYYAKLWTTRNLITKSHKETFKNHNNNKYYQFNIENYEDLHLRYKLALQKGFRGIGAWHLSCLSNDLSFTEDYSLPHRFPIKKDYDAMWSAIPTGLN